MYFWAIVLVAVGLAVACYVLSRASTAHRSNPQSPEGCSLAPSREAVVRSLVSQVNDFHESTRLQALGSLLSLGEAGWDAAIHHIEGSHRFTVRSLRSLSEFAGEEQAKRFLLHLMTTSANMGRRLDAGVALDGMGWAPQDHDQELHYLLATRQYARLFQAGGEGKQLVVLAMKHDMTREPACRFLDGLGELEWGVRALCEQLSRSIRVLDRDAFQTLVEIGMDLAIPFLISAQDACGDETSATLLLNCECRPLEEAAKSWAYKHGYQIVTYPGQTKRWGSLGLRH